MLWVAAPVLSLMKGHARHAHPATPRDQAGPR
ncbi:Uncharacterised protein [Actinomyces bovis]|uniref:Uncharacterized protein n=1 Tax=Actinomyces bovis TaxID=1658 RepID=A0ABY1VP40_9ACTO|nr:Uncharacterised protein [Actinomyces bovis]VEG52897.1 Uncharacterised protein [Actinomyces israelii]